MNGFLTRASILALAFLAVLAAAEQSLAQGAAAQGAPGGPSVTTEKAAYDQMEPITVNWANIALVNGWVGIGKPGGDTFVFATRDPYTSLPSDWQAKPASGSFTFTGRVAGDYEVRVVTGELHAPKVVARHRFTVKE